MLIIAHERSSRYGALLNCVRSMVFMATPHRGSTYASWGSTPARLVRFAQFGSGTNAKLLAALRRNSKTLFDISSQFVERGAGLQFVTFYETEALDYVGSLVIDEPFIRYRILSAHAS